MPFGREPAGAGAFEMLDRLPREFQGGLQTELFEDTGTTEWDAWLFLLIFRA